MKLIDMLASVASFKKGSAHYSRGRKRPLRIATFGSCLSRYTANAYVKLFDGKIVTSVYHNRSDAFLARFIDRELPPIDVVTVLDMLRPTNIGNSPDTTISNILNNQTAKKSGCHRLANGIPFLDLLERGGADLIIVDNYMDMAARLVQRDNDPTSTLFVNLKNTKPRPETGQWTVGELLDPAEGAASMLRILGLVRERLPAANLVFLNFPFNTYASDERERRARVYENAMLAFKDMHTVPCLTIHPSFQHPRQPQHFAPAQYAAYAGIIYQLLRTESLMPENP